MAATPYPIPRETRETAVLVGNSSAGPYGPTGFKVFDTADVRVLLKRDGESAFADVTAGCTIQKTADLPLATVRVWFAIVLLPSDRFVIQGARRAERSVSAFAGGALSSAEMEKELSKGAVAQQEMRRDVDRAFRLPPGSTGSAQLPDPQDGRGPVWSETNQGYVNGPSVADIIAVQPAAVGAAQARDFAQRWSSDPEDGAPIVDGENPAGQSSYHWSRKAQASAAYAESQAALLDNLDFGSIEDEPTGFWDFGDEDA